MHYFVHLSLDKHIKQIRVYKTTFNFVTNDSKGTISIAGA